MNSIYFRDFIQLQRGYDLPKTQMVDGKYPVVGSTSVIGYHNEYKIEPPGVITGRSGSLGTVQYLNCKYWPHNTSLWVKDFKGNIPRYVYYFLSWFDLKRFNSGAGVPTLNRNDLDNYEINIHEKGEQTKIASILSAYDDLIENNTRRIRILEQMAQSIYKEWFVNFRFPGHENVKFVDSPLGKIPEGWVSKKLEDIADITSSKRIYSSDYVSEGVPFYRSKEIIQLHNKIEISLELFISNEKYLEIKEKFGKPQIGDILITAVGTLGVPYFVNTNNDFYFKDGNLIWFRNIQSDYNRYVYYWMLSDLGRNELFKTAIGSSQPAFTIVNLKQIFVALPSSDLLEKFNEITLAITSQLDNLIKKNKNLRRTRDLLLPKLMSGEVEV